MMSSKIKKKQRGLWLDSAERYLEEHGWATCEMLRANSESITYDVERR
jgi:hypothetical protein